jgi:hypothetical protein
MGSGTIILRAEEVIMKNGILIPALPLLCILFAGSGSAAAEDRMEIIKKEHSAMNAVIEQFARDKNICNDEEQIKFAISPYMEGKDPSLWSDDVRKSLSSCREKYMVMMDYMGVESIYLYCYDGQVPKLMAPPPDSPDNRKNCAQGK